MANVCRQDYLLTESVAREFILRPLEESVKAIVVREYGGPDRLVVTEVPKPDPGPGEICIKVAFIGVNFTDVRNRVGDGLGKIPFTPGVEVSGVVYKTGPGSTKFQVGAKVAAFTRGHSYAEFVNAAEIFTVEISDELARNPKSGGMLVTVPLAINIIERAARVLPGETVLLHAAAGGVGAIVGQLLRNIKGVRLFGTVGNLSKSQAVQRNGYEAVMTYAEFPDRIMELTHNRGVDVVLDPIGGDVQARSLEVIAPFGRLVSYSNISRSSQSLPDAEWMRARCIGFMGLSNGQLSARDPQSVRASLIRSVELVESGALEIEVTKVLSLDQAHVAHQAFADRVAVGKFILRP
jgi:NADPH2:quinone reductase